MNLTMKMKLELLLYSIKKTSKYTWLLTCTFGPCGPKVQPYKADLCHGSGKQRRLEVQHIPLPLPLSTNCFKSPSQTLPNLSYTYHIVKERPISFLDFWPILLSISITSMTEIKYSKQSIYSSVNLTYFFTHLVTFMRRGLVIVVLNFKNAIVK